VAAMGRFGVEHDRIVAAAGPMIRQPNYEVGPEFIARFTAADAANARFFADGGRAGHALFDLAGYIVARLAEAGIRQVEDIGRCTYADDATFFSYRRSVHRNEADYGRHINAIALTE
jgi:purine-nucleoside/S-methyl-5'-thioadenosine phosphorylase / adenosine deaminase